MKNTAAAIIGNAFVFLSKLSRLGTGITWSGELALRLNPHYIARSRKNIEHVIVVAGTNGKTTTSAMIAYVMDDHGFSVIHNSTGANLKNGIAGTILSQRSKCIPNSVGIFEADEAAFNEIIIDLQPDYIVLLNLFRDQLDRYGEVDVIAEKWIEALSLLPKTTTLIANGDDPLIVSICEKWDGPVFYFGLNDAKLERKTMQHATDSIYCLHCHEKLSYKSIYISHQGDWYCGGCGWKRPEITLSKAESPLPGVYNMYNTLASVLTVKQFKISQGKIQQSLSSFKPAFGRQEAFEKKDTKIKILLSKNPTGFNESIRTVLDQKDAGCIVLALNDRIPDGTDVSWIWDVDFEMLGPIPSICTGDRAYDMGLRIKYSGEQLTANGKRPEENNRTIEQLNNVTIELNLKKAIKIGIEQTSKNKTLYILPTYSAMLDIRKILIGRRI